MKFNLSIGTGNSFTAYGEGYVEVNRERFESNLVVTPTEVVTGWGPTQLQGFAREDFAALLDFSPEIVLLGTGRVTRFPNPRLSIDLTAAGIGLDAMDVGAACRTYNVLAAEGRRVVAVLLLSATEIR